MAKLHFESSLTNSVSKSSLRQYRPKIEDMIAPMDKLAQMVKSGVSELEISKYLVANPVIPDMAAQGRYDLSLSRRSQSYKV